MSASSAVAALFRTDFLTDLHAPALWCVAPNGTAFLAVFRAEMAATFAAEVKPALDTLWQAREEDSWTGEAPPPSPDEQALHLHVAGAWHKRPLTDEDGATRMQMELHLDACAILPTPPSIQGAT